MSLNPGAACGDFKIIYKSKCCDDMIVARNMLAPLNDNNEILGDRMKTTKRELKQFKFPELLVDLHRNRKTGTLSVYAGGLTRKVYFDNGNAIFALSTDENERLGETLIKLGKITIDQYERSAELLKLTGKRQGAILVELGYLKPGDIVLGVKSQVREIIFNLFQIEHADSEFDEGKLPTQELITLQMSMANLIYEGINRIANVSRIKRDMPDMDAVLQVNEEPESFLQDIVLSPQDNAMIAMIDGEKTVKEIIESSPVTTFEAMKSICIFLVTGLVVRRDGDRIPGSGSAARYATDLAIAENEDAFEKRVNDLFSNLYIISAHDLLEIDETSDTNVVQSNYYRLINEFHPDQSLSSSDPIMLDKLIAISEEIQNAYSLLKEHDKRRNYFDSLRKSLREEKSNPHEEEYSSSNFDGVSEEMLSPFYMPVHTDAEGDENGEILNGIPMNQPLAFDDYLFEEKKEEFTKETDEANVLAHDDKKSIVEPEEDEKHVAPTELQFGTGQKTGAGEKRRHPRFKVEGCKVSGEMFFSGEVGIIDISAGGIAVKVDKQLRVGKEYHINLGGEDKVIKVKAEVVRSTLIETRTDTQGNIIPLYHVGMEFRSVTPGKQEEIELFINNHKIEAVKIDASREFTNGRSFARFHISSEEGNILDLKTCYRVKVLSLSGMLIESEQAVGINEIVRMKVSIRGDETLAVAGRTVSCRVSEVDPEKYDIAVEVIEISEADREKLKGFLSEISEPDRTFGGTDGSMILDAKSTEALGQSPCGIVRPYSDERYDEACKPDKEFAPPAAINEHLLEVVSEIRSLLMQIRAELPKAPARGISAAGIEEIQANAAEGRESTVTEPVSFGKDGSIDEEKERREERLKGTESDMERLAENGRKSPPAKQKNGDRKPGPAKKKLKLWRALIPALFLAAAAATFLFVYMPQAEKKAYQPAQPAKAHSDGGVALPAPVHKTIKNSTAGESPASAHTVELVATETTWLSAAVDEKTAREMILKPGDKVAWTAKNSVSLVIGNAAGLKVIYNGREISPLGAKGRVVRLKLPPAGNS